MLPVLGLNFVLFVFRAMLFTVSVSGVVAERGPCPRVLSMASQSTRVSPNSSSRGTRGLLLRRGLGVSLVDWGFSTPTGWMRYRGLVEECHVRKEFLLNLLCANACHCSCLKHRIVPTNTLRSSLLMLPTLPSATTPGSTGCARMCTSTASSVASPRLARSTVACAARATPTTRTGHPGEPPGSATRPSPSAATVELCAWILEPPSQAKLRLCLVAFFKFWYLCSEHLELC